MKRTPAAMGCGGIEALSSDFHAPLTLAIHRAQWLVCRLALPLETAAIMAALAFAGGTQHG